MLKRSCRAIDEEILEKIANSRGGSTAVVGILVNGVKLLVANVGDSRAILCRNGMANQISVDHEPQREKDLVESKGGFVSRAPGNDITQLTQHFQQTLLRLNIMLITLQFIAFLYQ